MAGMALPRIPWNFPTLCWLLAVPISGSLALECQEHQYSFHDKCCSDCAPGERMRSRCTASADTVCSPCQDGYFSSQHHHGFCKSCTICNARKGSVEVKPCEKTSDRVCACQAGFQPAGAVPVGRECSRCPEGTFSRGGNKNCQPWTKIPRKQGPLSHGIPREQLQGRQPQGHPRGLSGPRRCHGACVGLFIPAPAVPAPADGEWNFHPAPDHPGSPEKNQEWAWEEHPAQGEELQDSHPGGADRFQLQPDQKLTPELPPWPGPALLSPLSPGSAGDN